MSAKVLPFRHPRVDSLGREVAGSSCISWGTTSAYGLLGGVRFARIGFADIPVAGFKVAVKDPTSFVPIARQHIYRSCSALGLDTNALAFTVTVGVESRRRKFHDVNPSSRSHGKNKVGYVARYTCEIMARGAVSEFQSKLQRGYL